MEWLSKGMLLAAAQGQENKGLLSVNIVITGLVVVFVVLLVMIFLIKVFGSTIHGLTKKNTAKKAKKARPVNAAPPPLPMPAKKAEASEPVLPPAVSADSGLVPEEVIAVIAAAVATLTGGKGKIRAIKQRNTRSVWSSAGLLENTRPF